jgi:hypothetical protein
MHTLVTDEIASFRSVWASGLRFASAIIRIQRASCRSLRHQVSAGVTYRSIYWNWPAGLVGKRAALDKEYTVIFALSTVNIQSKYQY